RRRAPAWPRLVPRSAPAAGEDDLVGARTDQRRDLAARLFDRVASTPPQLMRRRRIAVLRAQERQHALQHLRIDRGSGIVIEVDGSAHPRRMPPTGIGRNAFVARSFSIAISARRM